MRFDRPTILPSGLRVRFRLPHAADRRAVRDLFARGATPIGEGRSRDLLRFDPFGRVVLCAVAPVGSRETVVGFGAIDPAGDGRPEVLVADEGTAPGVRSALARRLEEHVDPARRAA